MTVKEFINFFVARWTSIRVMHFPETDASAEVLYEGGANSDDIPDDVERRIVSSVIAIDCILCITCLGEDER